MARINKHTQSNPRPGGARRRRRQTKASLKTKTGKRTRTVTPVAKSPAVQILTISNVPNDMLEAIDELAAKQDRSRSSFVRRELQRIVAGYRAQAA
ncbi:MAG TPA: ribbon-helix-helix protein, CopG family [Candidatus Udaeobacter sp.]|nr:ribbon-helix-helix protein, CopG family [Candidatus Udaeobacter sp.]